LTASAGGGGKGIPYSRKKECTIRLLHKNGSPQANYNNDDLEWVELVQLGPAACWPAGGSACTCSQQPCTSSASSSSLPVMYTNKSDILTCKELQNIIAQAQYSIDYNG